jgi:hypothetical protein
MDAVQLSDLFLKDLSKKFHISPDQVIETLNAPDMTDDLDFHGLFIKIHTKLFSSTLPHSTLLAIETLREGGRIVDFAFRAYQELAKNLQELRPLEVLRLLTNSFGLLIRVGNQVGKLVLCESFSIDRDKETELVQGLESSIGAVIQSVYLKIDEGSPRTGRCALAFCLETDLYSTWLNSIERKAQNPKKTSTHAPNKEAPLRAFVATGREVDLRPQVAETLKLLPSERLHHYKLKLRHPAGIYHISVERLADRFEAALAPLERLESRYVPDSDPPDIDEAIEGTENLLRSMIEHIEDCRNILQSLFPDTNAWKSSAEAKEFSKAVEPYRDRIAGIVNAIKHRGGRVRPVFMHWGPDFAPGYFIEGESAGGIIGPDPNLHPSGDTAISLFRDIKLHFVHVYLIGSLLENAVSKIMQIEKASKTGSAETKREGDNKLRYRDLARRISLLPNIVYPDEVALPFPLIRLLKADDFGSEGEFLYGRRVARLRTFGRFKMRLSWGGDGVASTFKVPYMRKGWEKDVFGSKSYRK